MQTFEVVMLGNQAVGKTSMLSALSKDLDAYNLNRRVQLAPTTEEFKVLSNQWAAMLGQVQAKRPFSTLAAGIEGTAAPFVSHEFEFKVDGETEAKVIFTDTRGGLTGDMDEKLVSRVNEAYGVFCIVDAAVLMQCAPDANFVWNCPDRVKEIFNKVYYDGDGKQPRFVAFILTKCEKYMASEEGRNRLSKAFHEHYDNIVDLLHKAPNPPNVYMLAIQTMTCVTFYKLDPDNGLPLFRVLPAKKLATKDCAYPLVILLRNVIATIMAGTGWWGKLLQKLGWAVDFNDYLVHLDTNIPKPELYEPL
ncbi:MAG: hypothetical protein IK066_07940 [Kiritimatiellae bacterium]|nr:hypothetical protein [Kiritimatiellia bacterium]